MLPSCMNQSSVRALFWTQWTKWPCFTHEWNCHTGWQLSWLASKSMGTASTNSTLSRDGNASTCQMISPPLLVSPSLSGRTAMGQESCVTELFPSWHSISASGRPCASTFDAPWQNPWPNGVMHSTNLGGTLWDVQWTLATRQSMVESEMCVIQECSQLTL